ncbi:hypothetical protein Hanom_Chr05g00394671 [Helianthus anomalus]
MFGVRDSVLLPDTKCSSLLLQTAFTCFSDTILNTLPLKHKHLGKPRINVFLPYH